MNKSFIFSIIFVLTILFVLSEVVTQIEDEDSITIQFSGNENYSSNMSIYRYANVSDARINITSLAVQRKFDTTIGSLNESIYDDDYATGTSFDCNDSIYYVNYSIYGNFSSVYWNITDSDGNHQLQLNDSSITSNVAELRIRHEESCPEFGIDNGVHYYDFKNSSGSWINLFDNDHNAFESLYEEELIVEGSNFDLSTNVTNPMVFVNGSEVLSFGGGDLVGEYESTNFNNSLNNILSNGSCDGGQLSGDNCIFDIIFHSDDASLMYVGDNLITFSEEISPVLTISEPLGQYDSTQIDFVFTLDEEFKDSCKYWVERGESAEIGNRSISCSEVMSGSFLVSSVGTTYNLFVFANDTSGNVAIVNQTFTVSQGAVIISDGGVGIEEPVCWVMESGSGVSRFEASMNLNQQRSFQLSFDSECTSKNEISLSCENIDGSLCSYSSFSESFELLAIQDVTQTSEVIVDLDDSIQPLEYQFNIKATDQSGRTDTVTFYVDVNEGTFITSFTSRLFIASPSGIPYFVLFLGSLVFSGVAFFNIFRKQEQRVIISIILGFVVGITTVLLWNI